MRVNDLDGVCRLTSTYDVAGWALLRDKILEKEQEALLQRLLTTPNKQKLPKAAGLITTWRRLLKGVNADGAWTKIPLDVLERARTVAQSASYTAEFTNVLDQIVELSNMRVKVHRIKAAEAFKAKMKDKDDVFGSGLQQRLAQLLAGESFLTEEEGGDAEGGGEIAEPPAKRIRGKERPGK